MPLLQWITTILGFAFDKQSNPDALVAWGAAHTLTINSLAGQITYRFTDVTVKRSVKCLASETRKFKGGEYSGNGYFNVLFAVNKEEESTS